MFYSHEILTSQKYGVATVWLVATLGSKSNLKKVNRKAISEVDVPKACDTILDQDTPLALRLQSNLLYGVTRVYSQQCGYVLADAQSTQNNIKTSLKVVKDGFLDVEAGKTRSATLLLADDPGFLPDLPSLDFDFSNLDLGLLSVNNDLSLLSPFQFDSNISRLSTGKGSLPGLNLHTSNSGSLDYGLGGFTVPSSRPSVPENGLLSFEQIAGGIEDEGFLPDVDFEFDSNGNVRDIDPENTTLATTRHIALASSNIAHQERVRRGLSGSSEMQARPGSALGFDDIILQPLDEFDLPEQDRLDDGNLQPAQVSSVTGGNSGEPASESAEAPIRRRRTQNIKELTVDLVMELNRSELKAWSNDYVINMAKKREKRQVARAAIQAKKNSQFWVCHLGIGSFPRGISRSKLKSPLEMFSGTSLMMSLSAAPGQVAGRKRTSSEVAASDVEDDSRRKARRLDGDSTTGYGELAAIADNGMALDFDNDIEIGRAAMPELEDGSSTMPWNVGASARRPGSNSSANRLRQAYEGSIGGFPTSASVSATGIDYGLPGSAVQRARRLTSASPLIGRGQSGTFERLSSLEVADDDDVDVDAGQTGVLDLNEQDQFELFGPAASVDTQTAVQTQWLNQAFEQETLNFLDYVRHSIEQNNRERDVDVIASVDTPTIQSEIGFGELVRPDSNTKIVASQAFLHLLSLTTKNLLKTRQEANGGEIFIDALVIR